MADPQRVFVLQPLATGQLDDPEGIESVQISSAELELLRQRPLAREEFHIPPNAPKYRVLGRTLEGFLVVTGDPQNY